MAFTGQTVSQNIQAISQALFTAMVSKLLIKTATCGQTATQAPHLIQAFQPISITTGSFLLINKSFCIRNQH